MPINSTHKQYDRQKDDWQKSRDTIDGERAIRERIVEYLPPPPGMVGSAIVANLQSLDGPVATGGTTRYQFYARFAEFPEIVGPAVNGIQGLIHAKPPEVELPEKLAYLIEDATPEGDTLVELWEQITREILATGRISLLAEVALDDTLRLCPYSAESLINWKIMPSIEGGKPSMVVFYEATEQDDPDDEYKTQTVKRWRELMLIDGVYAVRLWQQDSEDGKPYPLLNDGGEELTVPSLFGQPFDEIPITVVNAIDRGFNYGPIPILPMVRRSLAIFRKSADYNRSLYIKGDPQPVLFGVDQSERPTEIGGGSIWCFSSPSGSAQFLDIDGQGIPLMRQSIADEFERFAAETGRLMESSERGAESGEALRRRQSMQLVTVKSLVINAATGLQHALRQIGRLMGLDQTALDGIIVSPNLDFTEPGMDAQELAVLVSAANMGAPISRHTIHELCRRRGLTTYSFDEEQELIDSQPPSLGLVGVNNGQNNNDNGER
jgi:hypothetical protein